MNNNREVVTAGEITKAIVWRFILVLLLLIFIYWNIYYEAVNERYRNGYYGTEDEVPIGLTFWIYLFLGLPWDEIHELLYSSIIGGIIEAFLMGLLLFYPSLWLSTILAFSKKIITYDSLSKVMTNLFIFTFIICIIQGIYIFVDINNNITELNESSKYGAVEEKIDNWSSHCVILEISVIPIYFAILLLERRLILKIINKADEDNKKTSILSREIKSNKEGERMP